MDDTLRGQHTLTKRQHSGGPRVGQNFTANYILPSWSQDEMTNAHLSLCQLWDKLQTESTVVSHPPIRAVPARQLASDTPHTRPWLWTTRRTVTLGKNTRLQTPHILNGQGWPSSHLLDAVQSCGHLCTQPQGPQTWACPASNVAHWVAPSATLCRVSPAQRGPERACTTQDGHVTS